MRDGSSRAVRNRRSCAKSNRSATKQKASPAPFPTWAARPPTCTGWRARTRKSRQSCRRLSCVYPSICSNLGTDHSKLIQLYRKARAIPGIKKILMSSGLRYDLAVRLARICEGTGHPPCRRPAEDRTRAFRSRAVVENDEARHGRLRSIQGIVRPLFERSRQGTIPDSVLHRGAPRHHR